MKINLEVEKVVIGGHPFVRTEARVGEIVIHRDQFDGDDIYHPVNLLGK